MLKMALALASFVAVLMLVTAVPASATYPFKLSVAVQRAYAPLKVKINDTCKKTIGKQLYALVAVRIVKSGKASTVAFQFINTAGWFAMWKDGKVLPAVPMSQHKSVLRLVNTLRARCA